MKVALYSEEFNEIIFIEESQNFVHSIYAECSESFLEKMRFILDTRGGKDKALATTTDWIFLGTL